MTDSIHGRSTAAVGDTDVVGARAFAQLVDGIASLVLFGLLTGGLALLMGGIAPSNLTLIGAVIAVGPAGMIGGLLAAGALPILLEWVWDGETIGKRLLGIRVVALNGDGISLRAAIVRNILATVDGAFFYLVGLASMMFSADRQRIGDRIAGTTVVRA